MTSSVPSQMPGTNNSSRKTDNKTAFIPDVMNNTGGLSYQKVANRQILGLPDPNFGGNRSGNNFKDNLEPMHNNRISRLHLLTELEKSRTLTHTNMRFKMCSINSKLHRHARK